MVDYRASLYPNIQTNIRNSYTELYKQHPDFGIFGKETIQKLLEIPEFDKSKYAAQTWSKIRKQVHRGLIDLTLFCNIASSDQLEKTLFQSYANVPKPNSIDVLDFQRLLPYLMSVIFQKNQNTQTENWKIDLANRILFEIFAFYRSSRVVHSKAYVRMLDEVEDFLKIEMERRYQ